MARVTRALVLSGGGARGAYEVGVIKALTELGVKFDIVLGTSVGAINGVFLAQNALDRLEDIWYSWRPKCLCRPTYLQLLEMLWAKRLSAFDARPIEVMLRKELDIKTLHASSTKAGFIVTDICSLNTRLITTDRIPTLESLIDVLMATCAIPFVFPPREIDGKGLWIDGGIVRNTPMLAALTMGATEIYTVLLHGKHRRVRPVTPSQYFARCLDVLLTASAQNGIEMVKQCNIARAAAASSEPLRLLLFQPQKASAVGILDFDRDVSKELIRCGYQDAIKAYTNFASAPQCSKFKRVS